MEGNWWFQRNSLLTKLPALKENIDSFDLKSWVTGGTKIWTRIPSNWRIFESNWLKILNGEFWIVVKTIENFVYEALFCHISYNTAMYFLFNHSQKCCVYENEKIWMKYKMRTYLNNCLKSFVTYYYMFLFSVYAFYYRSYLKFE